MALSIEGWITVSEESLCTKGYTFALILRVCYVGVYPIWAYTHACLFLYYRDVEQRVENTQQTDFKLTRTAQICAFPGSNARPPVRSKQLLLLNVRCVAIMACLIHALVSLLKSLFIQH